MDNSVMWKGVYYILVFVFVGSILVFQLFLLAGLEDLSSSQSNILLRLQNVEDEVNHVKDISDFNNRVSIDAGRGVKESVTDTKQSGGNNYIQGQGNDFFADKSVDKWYKITGDSMFPTLVHGNVVGVVFVDEETAKSELKVGDIVTYRKEGGSVSVTHRVESLYPASDYFVARGDNTDSSDGRISFSRVIGVVTVVKYAEQ